MKRTRLPTFQTKNEKHKDTNISYGPVHVFLPDFHQVSFICLIKCTSTVWQIMGGGNLGLGRGTSQNLLKYRLCVVVRNEEKNERNLHHLRERDDRCCLP